MATISPAELLARLRREGMTAEPASVVGFARSIEGDDAAIEFSPDTSCRNWIRLPLSLVGQAEPMGLRRCKDHSHNLVRIELRTANDSPHEQALIDLIAASPQSRSQTISVPSILLATDFNACTERCDTEYENAVRGCDSLESSEARAECSARAAARHNNCTRHCLERLLEN